MYRLKSLTRFSEQFKASAIQEGVLAYLYSYNDCF